MQTEVIISGFGGQGALFAGQLLAYAAMDHGLHVTWLPSYGPEMRGGTAHCTVIVADDEIGSPLIRVPRAVIAMNEPSLDKYEPLVAPGGWLVVNASLVTRQPTRTDIRCLPVPANEIAERLGQPRAANLVMLGALVAALDVLPLEALEAALAHWTKLSEAVLKANRQALREGAAIGRAVSEGAVPELHH